MRGAKSELNSGFWTYHSLAITFSIFLSGSSLPVSAADPALNLETVNQLTIGSTTLSIKHPDENTLAAYKPGDTEPLFQGERSDFQEPAAVLKYRIKAGGDEAALVELHNAGDIDETNFIILADQKGSDIKETLFGSNSTTFGGKGAVTKVGDTLRFERPAYPFQAGIWMEWSFAEGLKTGQVAFEPKGGLSLRAFYKKKNIKSLEPLENREFYQAVKDLPGEDRNRVLASMSGLANLDADSSGAVNADRYGLRKTGKLLAFSNCGLAFDGPNLTCFGHDSLVVWERKTGKFYVAVNISPEGPRYSRDDESVHFYPSVETWSPSAKSQLDDWQAEAIWADD